MLTTHNIANKSFSIDSQNYSSECPMNEDKKIVHDLSGWMKVYSDGSVVRAWTGPSEARYMTEPVPPHEEVFKNGVAVKDILTGGEAPLRARIYLPETLPVDGQHKLPILLHFHGGGFCISHPDWFFYYATYSRIATSANAVCVSIYLRLAPEHRLPAACGDGVSGLTWLSRVASGQEYEPWLSAHGDFSRIFLIGDSSGGNVAHHVAARAGGLDLGPARLAGAVMIHPGFCRATRSRSEKEQPESPFLTLDMADKFLELAVPVGSDKDHPIVCPMGSAAPPLREVSLPPVLLCLAEKDLFWDTQLEYYAAMKEADKNVQLYVSQGMPHSFYLNVTAVAIDATTSLAVTSLVDCIAKFVKYH